MIVKSKLASFFCGAVALPLFAAPPAAAAAVSTVSTVSAQKAPRKIERTVSPVTSGLNAADIADFRRALTTLAGLALHSAFGWGWADPLAALVLVPLIFREGLEGWRGECCCH